MEHIPVLDHFLRDNLPEARLWSLTTKQVDSLYKGIILLSANLIKAKEFNQQVDFLDSLERKDLRRTIRESPIILLGLRGFVFKVIQESTNDPKIICQYYKDYELSKNDFDTPITTNLLTIPFIKRVGLLQEYGSAIRNQPKALTPKEAKTLCKDELKKIHPYIQSYTYRKLRFIYHSNNMEFEDMVNTMECWICNSCYITLANRRGLHLTNTLKRGVNNAGVNLIKYYNTQSRRRLVADAGEDTGYRNIVVSVNMFNNIEDDSDLLENTNNYCTDSREELDLRNTFYLAKKHLQEEYGEASIQSRLMDILRNQSKEFLTWYNKKNHTRYDDITAIAEELEHKFPRVIKEYFSLKEPAFKRILSQIKPHLVEMDKEPEYSKELLAEEMGNLLQDLGILPGDKKCN